MSETDIIRLLTKTLRRSARVKLGVGDDAAVAASGGKDLLLTADMLIEGRHFRLGEATPRQIGRKAMAVNVSDIAAMAGEPLYALVSLGLPADAGSSLVSGLYRGLNEAAKRFGLDIVGGDTNRSEKLIVSVALVGRVRKGKAITRSGAKPGDVIFVSGELGGSYASKKHLLFEPRLKEAHFLADHFRVSAMMDLSDGLAADLPKLAEASGVGAAISYGAVPVSPRALDMRRALGEGEDFELLFTMPPREAAKLTLARPPKGLAFFCPIGKVLPKKAGLRLIRQDGSSAPLEGGFDHFTSR